MAQLLWNFFDREESEAARRAVLKAVLGGTAVGSEGTRLFCWTGPTPGVDLMFADQHDVLQACVELKRLRTPAQYSAVRHTRAVELFRSSSGDVDAVSAAIDEAARGFRPDRHIASDDACGSNVWHTQRRRDKNGDHMWWCAIPQIDLYRGYCLLPRDQHTAVRPQDPRNISWIMISERRGPVAERYPSAKSAACWVPRSLNDVLADLAAAAARLHAAQIETLRRSLDELR
jgi:hypothetical protein